jgi:2,3-bisphosphoglycerate-dependent phosphoglycerate mutase
MTRPAGQRTLPTVHLVRHGQSSWNLQHRVQGQRDEPALTVLGRQQAADAGRTLAGGRPARLLTSDLARATQTAAIIGRALGLAPIATSLLREQALGELEGLTTQQASARLAGVDLSDPAVRYAGGESRADVAARIAALLASPLLRDLDETDEIVLVSHGDAIRIAIAVLLGEDQADAPWRSVENGSVNTVVPQAAAIRAALRNPAAPSAPTAATPAASSGPGAR